MSGTQTDAAPDIVRVALPVPLRRLFDYTCPGPLPPPVRTLPQRTRAGLGQIFNKASHPR